MANARRSTAPLEKAAGTSVFFGAADPFFFPGRHFLLASIMKRCWDHDPAKRPSALELVADLRLCHVTTHTLEQEHVLSKQSRAYALLHQCIAGPCQTPAPFVLKVACRVCGLCVACVGLLVGRGGCRPESASFWGENPVTRALPDQIRKRMGPHTYTPHTLTSTRCQTRYGSVHDGQHGGPCAIWYVLFSLHMPSLSEPFMHMPSPVHFFPTLQNLY